jgi:hypothetical protein
MCLLDWFRIGLLICGGREHECDQRLWVLKARQQITKVPIGLTRRLCFNDGHAVTGP